MCKPKIGEHFEYHIHTVNEFIRRAVPFPRGSLGWTPLLNGGVPGPYGWWWSAKVKPYSRYTKFFAGWSGSMIWRVFLQAPAPDPFQPAYGGERIGRITFYPGPVKQEFDPDANFMVTAINPPQSQAGAEFTVSTVKSSATYFPQERTYYPSVQGYINACVKFDSNFFFIINKAKDDEEHMTGDDIGMLILNTPLEVPFDSWWSAGDDFRYWFYRPPLKLRIKPWTSTADLVPTKPTNIAGWIIKP
jgi:hypothetical protein